LKDYLDSSVRSGKAYSGSDRSAKGGSRFYDDTSAKSGRAFYDDTSAKSGRAYYGDSSAHSGRVYEAIPEHDPSRQSQDGFGNGSAQWGQQSVSPFANGNAAGGSPAGASGPPSKKVYKLTPLT